GEARLGGEGLAVPARSRRVELLVLPAEPGQIAALGGAGRLRLALQQRGQAGVEVGEPLGTAEPLGRRVGPARIVRAEIVPAAEFLHPLPEPSLGHKGMTKVTVGLGVVGLEAEGRAVLRDGVVQLALLPQSQPEVIVGHWIILLDSEGLAELGDGLIQLALLRQGNAEAVVALRQVLLDTKGLAELSNGLVQLALGLQGETEVVVGLRGILLDSQ